MGEIKGRDSRISRLRIRLFVVTVLLITPLHALSQVQERFPKPDFQSGYTRPDLITPPTRSPFLEYLDVFVLAAALVLATYLAHRVRSRRKIFILMVFSLVYFGFYRKGCICSIGAIQNVVYALFDPAYAIPLTALFFFILPLLVALFYGRTFCAAICPLGAIQDAVILRPVRVNPWLAEVLALIPYIYLSLAVLFAATGTGFVICQYDPFIGFFRFGAGFNMVILGISLLVLGTVVARPYCRFLCPLSVLLHWMSRLSKRHVRITPTECNNCRLCEESCPFGAIRKPIEPSSPVQKDVEVKKLGVLFILLPLLILGGGWAGYRLQVPLAHQHFTVALAEQFLQGESPDQEAMTDELKAFLSSGRTSADLIQEAVAVQDRFKTGGWILGGFLGFIIGLKLIGLSLHRRRIEYSIDKGNCLSCARCFAYCPFEQVRLGIITPEEAERSGSREGTDGTG